MVQPAHDGFGGFEIRLTRQANADTGPPIWLRVWESVDLDQPVREVPISPAEIQPDEFTRVLFAPIKDSKGRTYRVELDLGSVEGVAVWGSRRPDVQAGELLIAGKEDPGAAAYRVLYAPSLLNLMVAGMRSLAAEPRLVATTLLLILAPGLFLAGLASSYIALDGSSMLSFAAGAGVLLGGVVGLGSIVLGEPSTMVLVLVTVLFCGFASWLLRGRIVRVGASLFPMFALFTIILLIRLSFSEALPLPPYTDSIEHASIVADFLNPAEPPLAFHTLRSILEHYYHFGFHGMMSAIERMAGFTDPIALAVVGQILMALASVAMYFPIRQVTTGETPALVGVAVSAAAWPMPAHAANWGKYPAMAALAALPILWGMIFLMARNREEHHGRYAYSLVALSALCLLMLHTRAPLVAAVPFVPLVLERRGWTSRRIVLAAAGVLLISTATGEIVARGNPPLESMVAPPNVTLVELGHRYLAGSGAIFTLLAALGLVTLWVWRRRLAGVLLTSIMALLAAAMVPIPGAPTGLLIDRPFLEFVLFIPLTLSLSVGMGELAARSGLGALVREAGVVRVFASAGPFLIVMTGFCFGGRLLPQPWSSLAQPDEVALLESLGEKRLDPGGVVIAGERIGPDYVMPLDAGGWIEYFTGRDRVLWDDPKSEIDRADLAALCDDGARFLYLGSVGDTPLSDAADRHPELVEPVAASAHGMLLEINCLTSAGD